MLSPPSLYSCFSFHQAAIYTTHVTSPTAEDYTEDPDSPELPYAFGIVFPLGKKIPPPLSLW